MRGRAVELEPEDMTDPERLKAKGLNPEEIKEVLAHQTDHDDSERREPTPGDYRR